MRDRAVHGARHFPDSVPAHRELLRAVEARDPDAAVAAVEALLSQASREQRAAQAERAPDEHTTEAAQEASLTSGIAVAQPDLSHAGGISEVRRIAAMAEAYDVAMAPHCPLGPLALAASLQTGFAMPNFLIQEQSMGIHYSTSCDLLDYVMDPAPFQFHEGCAAVGTRPGLGVEIDEKAVRRAAESGHRWRNPVWRRADGSFTEW